MATKHEAGAIVKGGPPPTSMTSHRPLETKDGVTDDDRDERRAQKRDCFKRAAKFTFSQLGLCAVVCVYAVAGAFIFQHLEKTNEKQECVQVGLSMESHHSFLHCFLFCFFLSSCRYVIAVNIQWLVFDFGLFCFVSTKLFLLVCTK